MLFLFFFQAEDGIRDYKVTGVQTCALPIYREDDGEQDLSEGRRSDRPDRLSRAALEQPELCAGGRDAAQLRGEIGRASCRERAETGVGSRSWKKKRASIGEEYGTATLARKK